MDITTMVLGIFMVVLGLVGFVLIKKAQATKIWTTTAGTVISSIFQSDWGDINYEYYANGKLHTSNGIYYNQSASNASGNLSPNESGKYSFAPGSNIVVYYNPNNPQKSLLQPIAPKRVTEIIWMVGMVASLVIGISACMVSFIAGA